MKLNKRQIKIIANQVHKKLSNKSNTISEKYKSVAEKFVEEYKTIEKEIDNLNKKKSALKSELRKKVGAKSDIRYYYSSISVTDVLRYIKEETSNIPSISDIEDTIELTAIFSDEKDLNKFIENTVNKLTKNAQ